MNMHKLILENWKKFLEESTPSLEELDPEAETEGTQTEPELSDEDTFPSPEQKKEFENELDKKSSKAPPEEESFDLDPSLSPEDIASLIITNMKKRLAGTNVQVPDDVAYLGGVEKLKLTNFGKRERRGEIISALNQKQFFDSVDPVKYSGETKFKKNNKKITIYLKHGSKGTMAEKGSSAEQIVVNEINAFLTKNNIEGKNEAGKYFAEAQGGSSSAKDVVVRSKGQKDIGIEIKTSFGGRVDFGQFRVSYKNNTWEQAPVRETGEFADQKKMFNALNAELFDLISAQLNEKVVPTNQMIFPEGPTLSRKQAEQFWLALTGQPQTKSLSGIVAEFPVPKSQIRKHYKARGNDYLVGGGELFSLSATGESQNAVPSLDDKMERVYIVFRIKSHGADQLSYTCALRAETNKLTSPIGDQLEKIFLNKK